MRRALIPALCCLLLAGCITRKPKPAADAGGVEEPAQSAQPAQPARTVPGPVQVVGRVTAVDLRTLAVVVEIAPYAVIPPAFGSRILISRKDDLQPTARLKASPYLRGRTLGTRLLAGQPQVGDEVVLAPATP